MPLSLGYSSRRLYSIKLKKDIHVEQERMNKTWKEFMKETLKIPGMFQGSFSSESVV